MEICTIYKDELFLHTKMTCIEICRPLQDFQEPFIEKVFVNLEPLEMTKQSWIVHLLT